MEWGHLQAILTNPQDLFMNQNPGAAFSSARITSSVLTPSASAFRYRLASIRETSGARNCSQQRPDDFICVYAISFSLSVSPASIRETLWARNCSQQRPDDFICVYTISFSFIREQEAMAEHVGGKAHHVVG